MANDGVIVRFVTQPQTFIGGVNIEGKIASPPNNGELQSNSQLTLGGPFREEDVARAVDSMTRLLKTNGLYEGSVEPRIEHSSDAQQVFITFQIKPGKRAKYGMPVIQGAGALGVNTILRATGWRIPLIHYWLHVSSQRTRGGAANVQAKYQKSGRLLANVELRQLAYDAAHRRVTPHLDITPGPKVKVTAVEAKVSNRVMKRYVPVFHERAVDTDLLVEGKRNLEDYFQSQGYYDADVQFRVEPPLKAKMLERERVHRRSSFPKASASSWCTWRLQATNISTGIPSVNECLWRPPHSLCAAWPLYSNAFRIKDEANIADLYKANGFRDVKVATAVERKAGGLSRGK